MLGYGTAECAPVDVITGPGNVYVAAAKRLLSGQVAIDAEAGPTEIAIIADDSADPAFLAADLVAQAEHDPLAACLLITTDPGLADRVDPELAAAVAATRHADRVQAALAGQSACVLVDDLDAALAVSDAWAPEHLEIQADDAAALARRVRNAGAIFVGPWAPVSLGDYLAGSNHVLPTGGTARHSGGLSVLSFLRGIHVVECDQAGWPTWPRTSTRSAAPRTWPRTCRRSAPGSPPVSASTERGHDQPRCPLPRDLAGREPVRRAAARASGRAEHQREPVPAVARAGRRHRRRASPRRRPG